jgi:dihydrolipoamide dehydrogenase
MVVGEVGEAVDFLVVGGGPGGYAAAVRAAQLGREVTLVEERGIDGLGGTCLHAGCIPSKALIELAARAHGARRFADAGLELDGLRIDLGRFQSWKAGVVGDLAAGVARLLRTSAVTVVQGRARFTSARRVAVATPEGEVRFLEFSSAVVATGACPVALPGLDGSRVVDPAGALAIGALPESVAVVGAGYIGLELATAFARLGARVALLEAADRVLPTLPDRLTRPVTRSLKALGVDLRTGCVVDDAAQVEGDLVVVAVGRRPNTGQLGLSQAGVGVDAEGFIPVDATLRATERIAAVGDVVAGPALAHRATAQAAVAAEALSGRRVAFDALVPFVVCSEPEIASVGLTAEQARAAGVDARTAEFPAGASGRAATLHNPVGFTQLVVDAATDAVVGAHIVGPHAAELAAHAALAIEMSASPADLALTIAPHPTMSEGLREAAAALFGAPLHLTRKERP